MSSDQVDADQVASAVLAVPGVAELHAGVLGEIGTYLPGRRVTGVRVDDERCDVHVTLAWDAPVRETAQQVRDAVAPLVAVPVVVTVEDVATPGRLTPTTPPESPLQGVTAMNLSTIGLITGLLIAIAIAVGGFSGFLLAVVLGVAGFLVGGHLDGRFDLVAMVRGNRE
ncbi:MAG: DUF2273 domain-containing protein [Aeromicrobium erythreum]